MHGFIITVKHLGILMSDSQFTTTEQQASYGIGLQMGDQLNNMFEG